MHLKQALPMAERIREILAPYCERVEIAGSIRRRRDWCNDIDLVVVADPYQLDRLVHRCQQHATLVTGASQNFIFRLKNEVQLDIFVARPATRDLLHFNPTNFGSLLLNRTGSTAHNIWLINHAKAMGLTWNPYEGVFGPFGWPAIRESTRHVCLASETEEDIFRALGLDFIPPEQRER